MTERKNGYQTLWIGVSITVAILVALVFPDFAVKFKVGGEIFLRLLKMLVVPLVVVSVMSGILGLGDVRRLGRPGRAAILYYVTTTVLAVLLGLMVVGLMRPGRGAGEAVAAGETRAAQDVTSAKSKIVAALAEATGLSRSEVEGVLEGLPSGTSERPNVGTILKNLLLMLFTDNLFAAAVDARLLPLILFSIVFAGVLTTMGARVIALATLIEQANDALMHFVLLIMRIAPLGIFCLVTARFGQAQAEGQLLAMFHQTGGYCLTVALGLAVHAGCVLPLIYWALTRKNPYRFLLQMSRALLTAFSTASSSATLPVSMDCAMAGAGVSPRSVKFVLPLGATLNMDGTALYEAVSAIFIAQAIGVDLSLLQQAVIAVTATLAAIGAAGIPEAGLVTMIIVLNAVGLPADTIGLVLSVDWLLDRFRTTVNVWGDCVGAAVVERVALDGPLFEHGEGPG